MSKFLKTTGWALFITLLWAYGSTTQAATLTYPGPAPCDTTLQDCFDGANPGDTVEIATNDRIDDPSLTIAKSLTLKAAEGFFPVLGSTIPPDLTINRLFVSNQFSLASPMTVVIDGINFDNSEVQVFLPSGSGHHFEITNSRIAFDLNQAIRGVQVFTNGSMTFLIKGNSFFTSEAAILISPTPSSGMVSGIIQGNILSTLDSLKSRNGIIIDQAIGNASIDIFNNIIYGLGLVEGAINVTTSGTANLLLNVNNNTVDDLGETGLSGHGLSFNRLDTSVIDARIFNNIFSNLTDEVFFLQSGFPDASLTLENGNNNFFNVPLDISNDPDFTADASNLNVDPLYQDAAAADYRLLTGSELIDAGDDNPAGGLPTVDFANGPRIAGDAVDIGAFEQQADLSISKTAASTSVLLGDDINYTLTITNAGAYDSEAVTVEDVLPAGTTFVSATPSQGSCAGTSSLNCDLGPLASDATATIDIVVTADQEGTVTNTATVSGELSDPDSGNNSSSIDVTVSSTDGGNGTGGCGLGRRFPGKASPVFLLFLILPMVYFSFRGTSKSFRHYSLFALILTLLLPVSVLAADFNPGTAAELQQALLDSQANGADDVITLPAGTFATSQNGDATFEYLSSENYSLTLVGAGMGSTILDGDTVRRIMALDNVGGTDADITVRGMTFQNGDGMADPGGGLYANSDDGDVTIEDCEFLNNKNTGGNYGGFYANSLNGNITSTGNTITGNEADGGFGGVYCNSSAGAITFTNNTLNNNKALGGDYGGFFANSSDSNVTCTGNTVTGNEAAGGFGGAYCNSSMGAITFTNNTLNNNKALGGDYGGFFANSSDSNVTCTDNTVTGNEAGGDFGGAYCNSSQGAITFTNNTVNNNKALSGSFGGAFANSATAAVVVEGNSFIGNTATDSFGGLQANSSTGDVSLINNIIAHNTSGTDFGGVYVGTQLTIFVINNTIYDNSSTNQGGGLYIDSAGAEDINIYNNIAYANNAGTAGADINVANNTGSVLLFNNDFTEFCSANPNTCDPAALGGNQGGNKDVDPLFVDAVANDFRLLVASELIDAGTSGAPMLPATDLVGSPRIFGPEPDMGALEAGPQIAVDPTALDYGEVAVDAENSQLITLSNVGTLPLNISGIVLNDEVNYTLDLSAGPNPCGSASFILDFGGACTLAVVFNPQGEGDFSATLTLNSDDPNNPSLIVNLLGTGIPSSGGCSLEQVPSMISHHVWLWVLPLLGMYLWRRKAQ